MEKHTQLSSLCPCPLSPGVRSRPRLDGHDLEQAPRPRHHLRVRPHDADIPPGVLHDHARDSVLVADLLDALPVRPQHERQQLQRHFELLPQARVHLPAQALHVFLQLVFHPEAPLQLDLVLHLQLEQQGGALERVRVARLNDVVSVAQGNVLNGHLLDDGRGRGLADTGGGGACVRGWVLWFYHG